MLTPQLQKMAVLDPNAGYTFSSEFRARTPEGMPNLHVAIAKDPAGKTVGVASFERAFGCLKPYYVEVHPDHRRKGLASALYAHAEKTFGQKVVPGDVQTEAGKGLWSGNEKVKQFGKSEAPVYLGWFLDPETRAELLARYPAGATHVNEFADHATFAFKPKPEQVQGFQHLIGLKTQARVTHFVQNDKVQALVLDLANPTGAKKTMHITLRTAANVRPVESNKLLDNTFDLDRHRVNEHAVTGTHDHFPRTLGAESATVPEATPLGKALDPVELALKNPDPAERAVAVHLNNLKPSHYKLLEADVHPLVQLAVAKKKIKQFGVERWGDFNVSQSLVTNGDTHHKFAWFSLPLLNQPVSKTETSLLKTDANALVVDPEQVTPEKLKIAAGLWDFDPNDLSDHAMSKKYQFIAAHKHLIESPLGTLLARKILKDKSSKVHYVLINSCQNLPASALEELWEIPTGFYENLDSSDVKLGPKRQMLAFAHNLPTKIIEDVIENHSDHPFIKNMIANTNLGVETIERILNKNPKYTTDSIVSSRSDLKNFSNQALNTMVDNVGVNYSHYLFSYNTHRPEIMKKFFSWPTYKINQHYSLKGSMSSYIWNDKGAMGNLEMQKFIASPECPHLDFAVELADQPNLPDEITEALFQRNEHQIDRGLLKNRDLLPARQEQILNRTRPEDTLRFISYLGDSSNNNISEAVWHKAFDLAKTVDDEDLVKTLFQVDRPVPLSIQNRIIETEKKSYYRVLGQNPSLTKENALSLVDKLCSGEYSCSGIISNPDLMKHPEIIDKIIQNTKSFYDLQKLAGYQNSLTQNQYETIWNRTAEFGDESEYERKNIHRTLLANPQFKPPLDIQLQVAQSFVEGGGRRVYSLSSFLANPDLDQKVIDHLSYNHEKLPKGDKQHLISHPKCNPSHRVDMFKGLNPGQQSYVLLNIDSKLITDDFAPHIAPNFDTMESLCGNENLPPKVVHKVLDFLLENSDVEYISNKLFEKNKLDEAAQQRVFDLSVQKPDYPGAIYPNRYLARGLFLTQTLTPDFVRNCFNSLNEIKTKESAQYADFEPVYREGTNIDFHIKALFKGKTPIPDDIFSYVTLTPMWANSPELVGGLLEKSNTKRLDVLGDLILDKFKRVMGPESEITVYNNPWYNTSVHIVELPSVSTKTLAKFAQPELFERNDYVETPINYIIQNKNTDDDTLIKLFPHRPKKVSQRPGISEKVIRAIYNQSVSPDANERIRDTQDSIRTNLLRTNNLPVDLMESYHALAKKSDLSKAKVIDSDLAARKDLPVNIQQSIIATYPLAKNNEHDIPTPVLVLSHNDKIHQSVVDHLVEYATRPGLQQNYHCTDFLNKLASNSALDPVSMKKILDADQNFDRDTRSNIYHALVKNPSIGSENLEIIEKKAQQAKAEGHWHADAVLESINDVRSWQNVDLKAGIKLAIKFGVNKLRQLRDYIGGIGESVMPKALGGKAYPKEARNAAGNVSATQIHKLIEHAPASEYNYTEGEDWTGMQRHNRDNSKVFQVNLSSEKIKQLKDLGLYQKFRKIFDETYHPSQHPLGPHGLGWVRWTEKPDGVHIDEVQSDFARYGVYSKIDEANKNPENAQARYDADEAKKIHDVVFSSKHSSEVIQEAFQQYLRQKPGYVNKPVHIWNAESKAGISLGETDQKLPGHMLTGYNQVPERSLGWTPGQYGEISTQSNPDHKGKGTFKDVVRKTETEGTETEAETDVLGQTDFERALRDYSKKTFGHLGAPPNTIGYVEFSGDAPGNILIHDVVCPLEDSPGAHRVNHFTWLNDTFGTTHNLENTFQEGQAEFPQHHHRALVNVFRGQPPNKIFHDLFRDWAENMGAQLSYDSENGAGLVKTSGLLTFPKLGVSSPPTTAMPVSAQTFVRRTNKDAKLGVSFDEAARRVGKWGAGNHRSNGYENKSVPYPKRTTQAFYVPNDNPRLTHGGFTTALHETQHAVFGHVMQNHGARYRRALVHMLTHDLHSPGDLKILQHVVNVSSLDPQNAIKKPEEIITFYQNYLNDPGVRKTVAQRLDLNDTQHRELHNVFKRTWRAMKDRADTITHDQVMAHPIMRR